MMTHPIQNIISYIGEEEKQQLDTMQQEVQNGLFINTQYLPIVISVCPVSERTEINSSTHLLCKTI